RVWGDRRRSLASRIGLRRPHRGARGAARMNAALLRRALELNAAGAPAVLVRALGERGQAVLVAADERSGETATIPGAIIEKALERLGLDGAMTVEFEGRRFLLETFAPPARLIVVGAVHIAQKLVPMAKLAGYEVVLIDPRPAFA